MGSFSKDFFHKNSLSVTCYILAKAKMRTPTQSRFKNRTIDNLKLLGHNCNHQQGFAKQKGFTLHWCGSNLKLSKHLQWTPTQSRFKNRTIDSLKLLGHNCNHQQGFAKQKGFTLHWCGSNLKLSKHLWWSLFWVNIINVTVVTEN